MTISSPTPAVSTCSSPTPAAACVNSPCNNLAMQQKRHWEAERACGDLREAPSVNRTLQRGRAPRRYGLLQMLAAAGRPVASAAPRGERVVAATQLDADRHARQVEGLAQTIGEIAQVGPRQRLRARAEGNEGGRPRRGLRHKPDLHAAPLGGRRRMPRQCFAEPAVEVPRWHPAVPDLVAADHLAHEPLEAEAGKGRNGNEGDTRNLRELLL